MSSCFCDICDKRINVTSTSKSNISKSRKHKEKDSIVVKEYEFIRPDINRIDYITISCARDCFIKFIPTFNFRCIYDNERVIGDFFNGIYSEKKLEQIVQENAFTHKLTLKIFFESMKYN